MGLIHLSALFVCAMLLAVADVVLGFGEANSTARGAYVPEHRTAKRLPRANVTDGADQEDRGGPGSIIPWLEHMEKELKTKIKIAGATIRYTKRHSDTFEVADGEIRVAEQYDLIRKYEGLRRTLLHLKTEEFNVLSEDAPGAVFSKSFCDYALRYLQETMPYKEVIPPNFQDHQGRDLNNGFAMFYLLRTVLSEKDVAILLMRAEGALQGEPHKLARMVETAQFDTWYHYKVRYPLIIHSFEKGIPLVPLTHGCVQVHSKRPVNGDDAYIKRIAVAYRTRRSELLAASLD